MIKQPGHHGDTLIEPASIQDADTIKDMVAAAYSKYTPRIGRPPAPMTADYASIIASHTTDVYVLRAGAGGGIRATVGCILLTDNPDDDSIKVNNLVVDPLAQGCGYGRLLMDLARDVALAKGRSALTLFTNEMMWENLVVYPKMGFVEVERKVEDGYRRVYFRKSLAAAQ